MRLLDKLMPSPRWKSPDASVRLDALRDLNEPDEVAALAELDPDVRVRRAATARLTDPAVLARLVGSDDPETRERAADRLTAIAIGKPADRPLPGGEIGEDVPGSRPDTLAGASSALAAVTALADARRLAAVAKSDAPDEVRREAVARIADERALGSVARHARHEETAAGALARLTSRSELIEVALHGDHREVACAAFDRVVGDAVDLALLRTIETRGQHKAVTKRARTMIQQLESAEAAGRAAVEDLRRREQILCSAVEQVATIADAATARAELARLAESWRALGSTDDAARSRFARGQAAAEDAIVRRQRAEEEEADLRRMRAEAIATRAALCARVETLDGEDVLEQLAPIEDEWRSLLPLVGSGAEADQLADRFGRAVVACRRRYALRSDVSQYEATLSALAAEGETLVAGGPEALTEAARERLQVLLPDARRLIRLLGEGGRPAGELSLRIEAVAAVLADWAAVRTAEADKAKQDLLAQLQRLGERAKRVADADTITLREGERLMRDVAAGLEAAGRLTGSREIDEAVGRLRELQTTIAPRVREAREMDDWRRFANAQRQEQLIAMADAIVTSLKTDEEAGKASDLAATARALRELHAEWQQAAEAPRHMAQRLWDRFRTSTAFIRSRCEVHFAKLREERHANLEKKQAIVAEAESLAASTDWVKTAARFQQLQADWQACGPVPHEIGRELAHRFRLASNAYFARRREDMQERKKLWAENLAKKEAICERAETLVSSTDWDDAAAEIKRLQAAWKTIGPVRRNKSEVIWQRFRAAADAFFDNYHRRHEIALAGKLAEREAFVIELETLAGTDAASLPDDLGERVRTLRATWNRAVPVPLPGMKVLNERWQTALLRIVAARPEAFAGTDLDPHAVTQRMRKLVERVESIVAGFGPRDKGLSQTEVLAERLRSAFASNAMGGWTSEAAKRRSAADAAREAQAAWQRLAPVNDPEARGLEARFRAACKEIAEHTKRSAGAPDSRRPTAVAG